MKIASIWNGHDCSVCVLENGKPLIHAELERYIREKEPKGDPYSLLEKVYPNLDIDKWVTIEGYSGTPKKDNTYVVGHHQAHAANAFFSSNLKESLILTLDGGGIDLGKNTHMSLWAGKNNKIHRLLDHKIAPPNIGRMWTLVTKYVFGLSIGHPYGHSAGTVMATSCLGDPLKYQSEFFKNPKSFCSTWKSREEHNDPQSQYDVAATLQLWTETYVKDIIQKSLNLHPSKNLCLSGGVILNCVMVPKIYDWFPSIKNIYVTPTPHDGGLTLGAAQYLWHHELDNPRINWEDNFSPYLGKPYSPKDINLAITKNISKITTRQVTDKDVLGLLKDQKIISVFGGSSESGRRALGNRSILADPRSNEMKDLINKKVKHRQWFRPFAPSILKEEVKNWFGVDIDSPYMNFAIKFKPEKTSEVPAVVHLDKTGRIQTVTKNDNPWYYNFIKQWYKISGVPILLNTSFNNREPIVETPEHAINCFLGTDIDYLYFRDINTLIQKNES